MRDHSFWKHFGVSSCRRCIKYFVCRTSLPPITQLTDHFDMNPSFQEMNEVPGYPWQFSSPGCSFQTVPDPYLRDGSAIEAVQAATQPPVSEDASSLGIPYQAFAIIYIDSNGRLQTRASPSIADGGSAIFTPTVIARFSESVVWHKERHVAASSKTDSGTALQFRALILSERPRYSLLVVGRVNDCRKEAPIAIHAS